MTDSLLSRLQSATSPSRELDAEIALANGWTKGRWASRLYRDEEYQWRSPTGQICPQPPRYTEDIHAILRDLWPEGWTAWELCSRGNRTRFIAQLSRLESNEEEKIVGGTGNTPALALLIAIMQAKDTKP